MSDYDRAALNVVCDDLHVGSVWPGDSEAAIKSMQATINEARSWVATVSDGRARRAFSGWLDFFQSRVDAARKNLTTHAYEKHMEKLDREFKERAARADEITRSLPRPGHRINIDMKQGNVNA